MSYAIHSEPLFRALQLIDIVDLARRAEDAWYNQTLIQVGDVLVRLGVMSGEFHWHKHDEQDEFFFVVEGVFRIEIEDRDTVELTRGQGYCVPAGLMHRPVVPTRSVVLMLERAGVVATGD